MTSKEDKQLLFDALVSSMDFGSGFLDTDTVNALRRLAVDLGVDPLVATPNEFRSQYPHPFTAGYDSEDRCGASSGRCGKLANNPIHDVKREA